MQVALILISSTISVGLPVLLALIFPLATCVCLVQALVKLVLELQIFAQVVIHQLQLLFSMSTAVMQLVQPTLIKPPHPYATVFLFFRIQK